MKKQTSSATARLIAASTVWLAADERLGAFVPDSAARLSRELFARKASVSSYVLRLLCVKPVRSVAAAVERLTLHGIVLHYALRKQFIEDAARAALADGVRQVVVIGAGLDTLAARLAGDYPDRTFIEVDHPATQAAKVSALLRTTNHKNLHFVPIDLSARDLREGLPDYEHYDPQARTFFVAEGVLMYLDAPEVERVFAFVRDFSAAHSLFAWTYMERLPDNRLKFHNASRLIDWWLRRRAEEFRSGFAPDEVLPFLTRMGFAVEGIADADTLRTRYLVPAKLPYQPLAAGENICIARKI